MAAERSPLPGVLAVGLFVVLAGLLASAAPLLAYAGSLALFGLPHVLAELRYVDGRFGRRLGRSQVALILALLGVAVLLRILAMAHLADPRGSYVAELGIAAVGLFATVLFVQDFRGTRAAYGLVASVHTWIEIPILLPALTPLRAPAAASASAA